MLFHSLMRSPPLPVGHEAFFSPCCVCRDFVHALPSGGPWNTVALHLHRRYGCGCKKNTHEGSESSFWRGGGKISEAPVLVKSPTFGLSMVSEMHSGLSLTPQYSHAILLTNYAQQSANLFLQLVVLAFCLNLCLRHKKNAGQGIREHACSKERSI